MVAVIFPLLLRKEETDLDQSDPHLQHLPTPPTGPPWVGHHANPNPQYQESSSPYKTHKYRTVKAREKYISVYISCTRQQVYEIAWG